MLVLAIDTSTADLIVGLVSVSDASGITAEGETVISDTRRHNELLIPTIMALLSDNGVTFADVDAFVVGTGPGPFTGLRVGMATAAALGDALHKPVYGVCSLDAAAAVIAEEGIDGRFLVAGDARRKQVYWATYESDGTRVGEPDIVAPESLTPELVGAISQVSIPAALAPKLPESLRDVTVRHQIPSPVGLVAAADFTGAPAPLVPLYLRRPDAVPPKDVPRSPAIPHVDI